jgi:hypothetical protein
MFLLPQTAQVGGNNWGCALKGNVSMLRLRLCG